MDQITFDIDNFVIDDSTGTVSFKLHPEALRALAAKADEAKSGGADPSKQDDEIILASLVVKPKYVGPGQPYEPNPERPGKPMPNPFPEPKPTPDRPTFPFPWVRVRI